MDTMKLSEQAKLLAQEILKYDEQRFIHSSRVVDHVERVLSNFPFDLGEKIKQDCIALAYLHDIGHAADVQYTGISQLDGYSYLLMKSEQFRHLCNAIHFCSFAYDEVMTRRPDLVSVFNSIELSNYDRLLIDIITHADLHTDLNGELVTLTERCEDIKSRYGDTSEQYLYVLRILPKARELADKMWNIFDKGIYYYEYDLPKVGSKFNVRGKSVGQLVLIDRGIGLFVLEDGSFFFKELTMFDRNPLKSKISLRGLECHYMDK